MAYNTGTATIYPFVPSRSMTNDDSLSRLIGQIDNLRTNAAHYKNKKLGEGFLTWVEQFYSLERVPFSDSSTGTDTIFPLLQYLFLLEANDLTDSIPLFYIHKGSGETIQRDKILEKAIRNMWRQEDYNLEFLAAALWSLLIGVGFVEFGVDPAGLDGQGKIWGKSVHPNKVFVDPYATTLADAWYLVKDDQKYIDQIRVLYPNHADDIIRRVRTRSVAQTTAYLGLDFPAGPMKGVFGGDANRIKTTDGIFNLRTVWIKDSTTVELERDEVARKNGVSLKSILPNPKRIKKYPYGRLIVECEGTILYDSPSPYRYFPFADVHSTPPIQGFWNPPPLKFSSSIQSTAQSMLNQLLDNAARLNKGMVFIKESSNIDLEDFGGVAGEVHVIPQNSESPDFKYPPPMPPQMTELPFKILEYNKQLQGFNDARLGMQKSGNVSASMSEGATISSMAITRLRMKYLGKAVQRASEIILSMMQDYYLEPRFYLDYFGLEKINREAVEDQPFLKVEPLSGENLTIRLDPGSLEPLSSAALRTMVPVLRNLGLIDTKHALDFLRIPDGDEIYQALAEEAKAAAAAKEKSHGTGHKK